ncbi:MAG: lipopolysaccharide heptosyltransferase II [Candidatus Omnitrophota bacterium]
MKRILVINVNWLGDVLFSTPALKALRKNFPAAYICCVVIARCQEVLKNNPATNEIIVYDEYGKHRTLGAKFRFIRMLRKKKFDQVYILHPSLKRAMIGWLAGIPQRIGYDTKKRKFLLTNPIPAPDAQMHKIDYFLNLLKAQGVETEDRNCEFFVSDKDREKADEFLKNAGITEKDKIVMINPGGNWQLKRWPLNYFVKLSDALMLKPGIKVLVAGAKKDIELARKISSEMKKKPLIITGKTTLHELAALMIRSDCVVSADSGPMHISRAVGANTVAIFGPTSPELTGPVGKGKTVILRKDRDCEIPCYKLDCDDNCCMKDISPEEVLDAVNNFLEK